MPTAPKRPCSVFPCHRFVPCPVHGKPNGGWSRPASGAASRLRGGAWMKLRAQVLAQEPTCAYCGRPGQPDDVVDHVRGVSAGGDNSRENLKRSCRRCNQAKQGRESAAGKRR